MPKKAHIYTNASVPATGAYSQGICVGNFVFLTGQTGRHPDNGKLEEGLEAQTHRVLANIEALLKGAGCRRQDIVRTTLLLTDINDFEVVEHIYAAWIYGRGVTALPARTVFQAGALPHGALLMIEVTAVVPDV